MRGQEVSCDIFYVKCTPDYAGHCCVVIDLHLYYDTVLAILMLTCNLL